MMDARLKKLSYSSRLLLHKCPRKYQLYKLGQVKIETESEVESSQSVTFAFGHVVGLGIQEYLVHGSIDLAFWACFQMWSPDLLEENTKQAKSFWRALAAIQRFASLQANGFLDGWEVYMHEGKPAVELSFIIIFPDGFTYKGFVDVVLQHKVTKEVRVIEVKTTAMANVAAATYKNSAQAIGYSIVLDNFFPTLSSYQVQYVIYKTKASEFEVMDFTKDYLSRALWIREILLDIEMIRLYENASIYPQHGESCNDFYRECEYMGICQLSTDKLIRHMTAEQEAEMLAIESADFQINLSLNDLIHSQLNREMDGVI
jgi:hypothetical protein